MQKVNFLIDDIQIGQQPAVLLLRLYEGSLNLINVSQTCCLFYCVEGLVNNRHVALVHVDDSNLLFVVEN